MWLGVVLHYIRLVTALAVVPSVPTSLAAKLVVLAWSGTEVFRYPMFMFPKSDLARAMRYLVPVATFPVGAAAEAIAAYLSPLTGTVARAMVASVISTNLLLGTAAYPGLVKKGIAGLRSKPGSAGKSD